jgi:hypothetical protein
MSDLDRETVKALDTKRRELRVALTGDVQQAKRDLHPRTLFGRWKQRKAEQISALAGSGKQNLANNAPLVGLAGAAILLFTARKPISRLYNRLRQKAQPPKDETS